MALNEGLERDGVSDEVQEHAAPAKRPGRRVRHLRVPVHPDEAAAIEALAKASGMSIAAYLRAVGMGYQPRSIAEHDQVQDMLRINGDLGRLGGLLKLWLTDDRKLEVFPVGQIVRAIRSALREIESTQDEMRGAIRQALRGTK